MPEYPLEHLQSSSLVAAKVVTEFEGHFWQGLEPLTVLKEVELHALHAAPSLPVYPTLHLQLELPSLRAGEAEYDGHA